MCSKICYAAAAAQIVRGNQSNVLIFVRAAFHYGVTNCDGARRAEHQECLRLWDTRGPHVDDG